MEMSYLVSENVMKIGSLEIAGTLCVLTMYLLYVFLFPFGRGTPFFINEL